MKIKLLTSTLLLALTSTTALSASINLRHEYMPDREGDKHRDRITVAHRFKNNIGFSVEAKWKHHDDELIKGFKSAGHEVGVSYNYKIGKIFTLQPAYAADVTHNSTTHKYNLRAIAKISDSWSANFRYRYGDQRRVEADNNHYHQLNLVADYSFNWGKVGVDLEYKDLQDGVSGWKDKSSDHLVNFFGEYNKFSSGWIPFAEVGFITFDKDNNQYKDDYAMRYRLGVKYNF